MSFANKTALGLQGLGDDSLTAGMLTAGQSATDTTDLNALEFAPSDPNAVGPSMAYASSAAQANQAALLTAQQAVIQGSVGVPSSTPSTSSSGNSIFVAIILLAAGFMIVEGFKR